MKKIILLLLLSPILLIIFTLISPLFILHNIVDSRRGELSITN